MTCNCPLDRTQVEAPDHSARGVEQYLPDLLRIWSLTRGSPEICIAVLDGGIDGSHPCFTGANLKQLSRHTQTDANRGMALLHGTHVTSLIFGQHDGPYRGVAPGCRGVVIPVYGEDSSGNLTACTQLDLARAISLAMAVGANVINISGGHYDPSGEPEPMLARTLAACAAQNVLVVAAAGNNGCRCLHVPAATPSVLAVGALDSKGQPTEETNWGDAYQTNGITAPGEAIEGAVPGGELGSYSGTSQATALVSGVVGLLMSMQAERNTAIDATAIVTALHRGAGPCDSSSENSERRCLVGQLDLMNSLPLLLQGDLVEMNSENTSNEPVENAAAMAVSASSCQNDANEQAFRDAARIPGIPASHTAELLPSVGGGQQQAQLVYVLGLLRYDFGTEARLDGLKQRGLKSPWKPKKMADFLEQHPLDSASLTWILAYEDTPMYAIQPVGPHAEKTYDHLQQILRGQYEENGIGQVAIPGIIAGNTTLMNGMRVPVIWPDLRGIYAWSSQALIDAVAPKPINPSKKKRKRYARKVKNLANFLDRVYYELANMGDSSQDRALNFAATNLFQVADVFSEAVKEDLKLDEIEVERSGLCRPNSDCWDVKLTLFDPTRRTERAREVFRLTIDVSEVLPVTVGRMRHWSTYADK